MPRALEYPDMDKTPKNCPFNEVNRSPDSFVRISNPGQDGQSYQRASLVSSAKTTTKSVLSVKEQLSVHSQNSKKEELKKNIEINLEKIINIQTFLEQALEAYEKISSAKTITPKQLQEFETLYDK